MVKRLAVLPLFAILLAAQPLPVAKPQDSGFAPDRLERLHNYLQRSITDGQRAGAILLLARDGKIVDWQTFGYRDLEAKAPMQKDTICRIYSMSKIITSVAVLQLLEEGKFELNDPVEKYIPELKDVKVFRGGTAEKPEVSEPKRPMTIKHLLTHTSGLVYGGMGKTPVHQISEKINPLGVATLKEFAERTARVPLLADPGEQFTYSISTDMLGYLVERVSGMPFDRYLQKNILGPLGMVDTAFDVPEQKRSRMAKIYRLEGGKLKADPVIPYRGFASGGGGLYSTTADYARFAQMLLNGGELNGVRILGKKTVELMTANHMTSMVNQTVFGSDSTGFGLGVSVRLDVPKAGTLGSVGTFGWSGAATTYVSMDPKERTIALLYEQFVPMNNRTMTEFSTLFYQALVK